MINENGRIILETENVIKQYKQYDETVTAVDRVSLKVYEGEFVANHLAVQNPAVRPVLDLIDSAQRSGTISTLTPLDVSRAVAAPAYTSATARTLAAQPAAAPAVTVQAPPAVVVREDSRTAEALQRLNDALEEGIRASVSIDGRDGLDRQWRRWQEMKKRT